MPRHRFTAIPAKTTTQALVGSFSKCAAMVFGPSLEKVFPFSQPSRPNETGEVEKRHIVQGPRDDVLVFP
jgi:hypothetical protein